MTARVALVAAALALPQLVPARPAVVRTFEASARAEPASDAAVVHRFPEGAEVSVSEEVSDGWRRVRLPDGATAWIQDAAVALGAPGGAALPPPDLRPRLVVEDASQLPPLMAKDPRFAPRAEALVHRQRAAFVVAGLSLATSVGLGLAGASQASSADPRSGGGSGQGLLLGATATAVGGLLLAVVIHPARGELLDLLSGWNVAHPEAPLALQPVVIVPEHVVVVR